MSSPPTDFSKQTLSNLNEEIKFADRKASALLTGQLAFLGLLVNVLNGNWAEASIAFKLLSAGTALTTFLGAVFAGWVIYPQTESSGDALLFWGDISTKSLDNYKSKINKINKDKILKELIKENYLLAEIVSNKYDRLKCSLKLTAVSIVLAALSMSSLFI